MLEKLRFNDEIRRSILVILLLISTLVISVSGVGAITTVTSKMAEANFSNFSGPITLVTIATDRLGILTYTENYYLVEDSGALKYDKGVKYYEKGITRNRLTLEILRPNSSSGKPYPAILATVLIDNQTVFQGWFKQYKQQKTEYQVQNPQVSPLIQNTQNVNIQNSQGDQRDQTRKLPGFEIIAVILAVSTIYWFRRQKEK